MLETDDATAAAIGSDEIGLLRLAAATTGNAGVALAILAAVATCTGVTTGVLIALATGRTGDTAIGTTVPVVFAVAIA